MDSAQKNTIEDKLAVVNTLNRMLAAADRKDWASARNEFLPEIMLDHDSAGEASKQDSDNIISSWAETFNRFNVTWHSVTNQQVTIEIDCAVMRSLVQALHVDLNVKDADNYLMEWGTYTHNFIRTEQGWKISAINYRCLYSKGNPSIFPKHAEQGSTSNRIDSDKRRKNLEVVQAYFRLQTTRKLDEWVNLWADDGVFMIPYAPTSFPNKIEGKTTIGPLYKKMFEGYGELRYHNLQIFPMLDPDFFVATWITDVDLLAGGTYVNNLIATFKLRAGKIERYEEYFDPTKFLKVLSTSER